MGTNQSQVPIHSKIWSLSIRYGPLTLWVMINPSDLHDLIAQVFCGSQVDLDHFQHTIGLMHKKQQRILLEIHLELHDSFIFS